MKAWPLILAGALLTSACAHPPERNAVVARAEAMTQRAAQAYAKGELATARNNYSSALRLYESLADSEGRARTLLSLARVTAQAGKPMDARAEIEALLAEPGPLNPATRLTAHGRAAGLALTIGDTQAAQRHLDQAATLCTAPCPDGAPLTVLRARVRLTEGKAAEALTLADKVVADSAHAGSEHGNALRVRAQALAALGKHREATEAATLALGFDQKRGRSELVILDLQLLAQAHQALGAPEIARRYQTLADRARAARRDLLGGGAEE